MRLAGKIDEECPNWTMDIGQHMGCLKGSEEIYPICNGLWTYIHSSDK
jgi:hypothetical protein